MSEEQSLVELEEINKMFETQEEKSLTMSSSKSKGKKSKKSKKRNKVNRDNENVLNS